MPNFAANILITMKPYPGNNIGREKLMHNNGMQTETIFIILMIKDIMKVRRHISDQTSKK